MPCSLKTGKRTLQSTQHPTEITDRNNFDLLRLFLALSVCFSHLGEVSGTSAFLPLASYFYSGLAVDSFFVVSGFLIFRSFEHSSSLLSYMNKRVRRIYPAYLVVVVTAALLLPLFFSSTAGVIYSHTEWARYLVYNLLFMNFMQPEIPALFTDNPLQVINAPLWTIKVEVMFYLFVPILFLFLKKSRQQWILLLLLYIASVCYSAFFLHQYGSSGNELFLKFEKQLPGQLSFFLSGGGLYLYFPLFKRYWKSIFTAAALLLLLSSQNSTTALICYPLALSILIISIALLFPYLGNWGKFGDMSYGVYIYHFPIIQVFTTLSLFDSQPWLLFIALMLTILSAAFLSYHCIERPFLKRSSHYRQAAEQHPSP